MAGNRTVTEAGICINGGAIAVAVTVVLRLAINLFVYLAGLAA